MSNNFIDDDFDLGMDLEEDIGEASQGVSGSFPQISNKLEQFPHNSFDNPDYYKIALSDEGEVTQRVNGLLQKYLKCKDPKDKGVFRQQITPAFWEFLGSVAKKCAGRLQEPKKYLLRFGLLHPAFLNEETRKLFARVIDKNFYDQPVYYLDEWLRAVGTGELKISATDEVQTSRRSSNVKYKQLLEKAKGKLDGARALVKARDQEKFSLEKVLMGHIAHIGEHFPHNDLPEVHSCYTDSQKKAFYEVQEIMKSLIKVDREQGIFLKDYLEAERESVALIDRIKSEGEAAELDLGALNTEFETIKQMAKMTIGRRGNHFPVLTNEYFRSRVEDVGFRENVISMLAWIESIDPEAFCRVYRNSMNRIVPYVILLPTYGDTGFCWEPYDRYNRATSRGRIAVPMYPKSLQYAVLTAVADLRWQVAKEKASYYWMEEGITGHYFQWFQKMKLKGDLKDYFIQDYITWITRESEGTQKLDKDLRGTFWRYLPFSQPIKEKLKNRNFVYQELYQRDVNRSMSDGY